MSAVGIDEELHGANPMRRFAPDDGGRDARPPQRLAQLVSRDLALVQGARLKIPQRRFASARLVDDRQTRRRMGVEGCEERVVGRSMQQAYELHLGKLDQEAL